MREPEDDDLNPTRPTPHGTPDRRYIDRSPRSSERIPAAELAEKVDEFLAVFAPHKPKRKRQPVPPPEPERDPTPTHPRDEGDGYDRGEQ